MTTTPWLLHSPRCLSRWRQTRPWLVSPSARASCPSRQDLLSRGMSSKAAQEAGDVESKPTRRDAAPTAAPATDEQIDQLADFITRCKNVLVISGAGFSTESGIPDYRSPNGAYSTGFRPMLHQHFVAKETNRRRYWARSFVGWQEFNGTAPNIGHRALAKLEAVGWITGTITQNVDRLHQRGGSARVVELHGTTHEVICLDCGNLEDRQGFQDKMASLNPGAARLAEELRSGKLGRGVSAPPVQAADARAMVGQRGLGIRASSSVASAPTGLRPVVSAPGTFKPIPGETPPGNALAGVRVYLPGVPADEGAAASVSVTGDWRGAGPGAGEKEEAPARPDGDAELGETSQLYDTFAHPPCEACGSVLVKPNVVFFGDSIPKERTAAAEALLSESDGVLVLGSSLMVWSAFRLVKAARDRGMPVAAVCIGETRADDMFELKVEARVGETLARLAAHPSLQFKW